MLAMFTLLYSYLLIISMRLARLVHAACVTAAETVCYTELTWNKSMLQTKKTCEETPRECYSIWGLLFPSSSLVIVVVVFVVVFPLQAEWQQRRQQTNRMTM